MLNLGRYIIKCVLHRCSLFMLLITNDIIALRVVVDVDVAVVDLKVPFDVLTTK